MNRNNLNRTKFERRARRLYSLFACLVAALTVTVVPAFAADDPLAVVNNLSEFIFSLIRAVGLILLGFGILQIGPLPAGQRHAHRGRRYCHNFYQGDPHPHHRLTRPTMVRQQPVLPPLLVKTAKKG